MRILKLGMAAVLLAAFAVVPAHASAIAFEFVCQNPSDCDGDAGLSLTVSLDSSVVAANTYYAATAASHAAFLGWTAASASANDDGIPNYNGFSTSGDWSNLLSVDPPAFGSISIPMPF